MTIDEPVKLAFALVAVLFAVAGNMPYVLDVLRGTVKPHAYSWFVWSIVSCIVFFGQLEKGAGVGVIATGASEIFTIIIFLLSLRYGFRGTTRSDTIFLAIALVGIVPWILTSDPTASVVIAAGIDIVAFIPTLRKTWHQPETENPYLYLSNIARHVLALFSLQAYNVATMAHSVAMLTANTVMTGIIFRRGVRSLR